ncbi:MAG: sigma 54-interacting transcriptional regulator [Bacteroidales bacterium]
MEKSIENIILNGNDNELVDIQSLNYNPKKILSHPRLKGYAIYSDNLKSILDKLDKMANSRGVPLLITGDTGSGKELISEYMHYEVDKDTGEYVAFNCSNINKELFESELFGYEKGAFTGAHSKGKEGYFQQAKGGTLLLDEITEINHEIQAKLLRVLETGEYYKVGGRKKHKIDSRLIFATNKNLEKLVEQGEFREDLYYRLNIVNAEIPKLSERREEIIPLVVFFINHLNQQFQKSVQYIEKKVLKLFYYYTWPGNIRELKNFITQLMIFTNDESINFDHLQIKDKLDHHYTKSFKPKQETDLLTEEEIIEKLLKKPINIENFTRKVIQRALNKFKGNKAKTARYLGLKREQLYNRYRIDQIKEESKK